MLFDFHFIRPYFLVLLVPLLFWRLMFRLVGSRINIWRKVLDDGLFKHIFANYKGEGGSKPLLVIAIWVLVSLAMAGPAWEEKPRAMYKNVTPTVILLDASLSMNATDVSPTRLSRGIMKIYDILEDMKGSLFSLIVYSAEPFVVVPITDDSKVIEAYLPIISSDILPSQGTRADRAIDLAVAELERNHLKGGHIVLITDTLSHDGSGSDVISRARKARLSGHIVSVLGIGTEGGEVIKTKKGKGRATTKLEEEGLIRLVNAGGGRYHKVTGNNEDIKYIFSNIYERMKKINPVAEKGMEDDMWVDQGVWLVLPLLVLFPLLFRKGVIVAWLIAMVLGPSQAEALDLRELFVSPQQYGKMLLDEKKYAEAAEHLAGNPQLQAFALIRAGKAEQVIPIAATAQNAGDLYNIGTMLALSGEYPFALEVLEKAKAADSSSYEAAFNYEVVKRLIDFDKKNPGGDGSQSTGDNEKDDPADKGPQNREPDQGENPEEKEKEMQDNKDEEESQDRASSVRENPQDMAEFLKQKIYRTYRQMRYGAGAEDKEW